MGLLPTTHRWMTFSSQRHQQQIQTVRVLRKRKTPSVCSNTILIRSLHLFLVLFAAVLFYSRSLFTTLEGVSYTAMSTVGLMETVVTPMRSIHPRYIEWNHTLNAVTRAVMLPLCHMATLKPALSTPTNASNFYKLPPNRVRVFLNAAKEVCVPVSEWQTQQHPSCNTMHEVVSDVKDLVFVNHGSASYVMKLNDNDKIVIKGSLYKNDFDTYGWKRRQVEQQVQEHFTASPFVTDIYTSCAYSFLAPFSPGGSLYEYIVSMKYFQEPKLTAMDKLKMAIHLASGVQAIHDLGDQHPNATLTAAYAHNDLDSNQYIYHDGLFQLTDFNYGKLNLQRLRDGNVPSCFQMPGMHPYLFRSPEDLGYAFGESVRLGEDSQWSGNKTLNNKIKQVVKGKDEAFDYSQSDVFNLGSAMHAMWSLHWMWNNADKYHNLVRLLKGERPPLNVTAVASKHEMNATIEENSLQAHTAVAKAVEMCWIHDPKQRPIASHVVKYLKQQLAELIGLSNGEDISLQHLRLNLPKPTKPDDGSKKSDKADDDFKHFLRL